MLTSGFSEARAAFAEETATLSDSGQWVGTGTGIWSETFTYDERSNLITQTDARGVKTVYSYNSDPLNRLQSVSYDISGFGDTGHPILPAAGVTYEYIPSGDKTRLFKVTTAGVSTDEYGYDGEGRVSSRTLTMTSRPGYPMLTDYIYDTLNRVTDVRYPAEYGMPGNPRKVVHQDYDASSRLTGLKVDGADYAKNIVYNAASQTTSLKVGVDGGNQITESYQYADTTGLLTNQKVQRGATSLMDLSYDYLRTGTTSGRTGQLTKILNNLNHNRDRGYVYDALGRLTTATGGQAANWTQTYVYDRYGNRTSVTASGTTSGPQNNGSTNQPPVVSITAPTNGATFTAPANITIRANASDPDGTISKVEFYRGTTLLGSTAKSPYVFVWTGVQAGSYALTAKAYDNAGATTTSTAVNITVNAPVNNPPTVSITSPASGAIFMTPAYITINANASDSDGTVSKVEFFNGATKLGESLAAPYSFAWNNVAAGSYSLTAKATDNLGATATSGVVNITVNSPPTVSITQPVSGATFTAPANITINANASDSDGAITQVEFFQGATSLGVSTTAPYALTWASVAAGSYSLTARATDNLGATTTSSIVNVTVCSVSGQPPTVSMTQPSNGQNFTGPCDITLNATATASCGRTISKVEFFSGTTLIKTLTVAPYKSVWLNVAVGSYTLTAKATDNTGASTTSAAVHITVTAGGGNQPPTVSITQPAQGATFTAPASIAISANAADSDGSVSRVEFFANGSSLGVDTTAPYSITWSGVAAGSYSLTARATDNLGATTTSSAVGITVNPGGGNQPPVANAGGPYSGTVSTAVQFNGSGSYDPDGTIASYNWSFGDGGNGTGATPTHVYSTAGTYTVTLTVTDNQGAQASASTSATISSGGGGTPVPGDGLANVSYDQATNRINTAGWEYDAAGNQTRVQRVDLSWQRYVYDAAGRLVKVQNDSGVTQLVNTYGASNHRLIEQVGNESSNQRTYYAWAGDSVIAEYSESATNPTTPLWSKSYVYLGARLLATIAPNGGSERVEYQHPDRLGTRIVTNNQDTSSFDQLSLPFGTALDAESSGSTKRRFTSYDRSTVTGLDYAVNRHYDPLQGRFTQVDPIGMASVSLSNPQTLNLFAYCTNDPINHTDPSGLGFWSFLGKVFSFFAKIAKWVAIVVAVAVLVAVAFPVFAPVLGTVLFDIGIWQLGAGVSASFLTGGVAAAGISLGATSFVLGGLAAAGAVNSFMQKKSTETRRNPRTVKLAFYNQYQAKLNDCIQELFGVDAKKIKPQSLKNAPALDPRLSRSQLTTLVAKQLGINLPSGVVAASSPRGRFGTVFIASGRFNDPNYPNDEINRAFAHELGNILSYKSSGSAYTYGDPNGIGTTFKDKDTGAKLEKCIFGNVTF